MEMENQALILQVRVIIRVRVIRAIICIRVLVLGFGLVLGFIELGLVLLLVLVLWPSGLFGLRLLELGLGVFLPPPF